VWGADEQPGWECDKNRDHFEPVTSGVCVWTTVMLNAAEPVFPARSVNMQCTVVVPGGRVDPEAGERTTGSVPSTRSVAVAVNVTVVPTGLAAPTATEMRDLALHPHAFHGDWNYELRPRPS